MCIDLYNMFVCFYFVVFFGQWCLIHLMFQKNSSIGFQFSRPDFKFTVSRFPATTDELRNAGIILSHQQIASVMAVLQKKHRFLVFGVGNDSKMWSSGPNTHGSTMFVENNENWTNKVLEAQPSLDIRFVDYKCNMAEAFTKYFGDEAKLTEDIPDYLKDTKWDVILVDGPMGFGGSDNPGRMKSIYWASKMVVPNGHVFVHDIERHIEHEFSRRYLEKDLGWKRFDIAGSRGDLAHFSKSRISDVDMGRPVPAGSILDGFS